MELVHKGKVKDVYRTAKYNDDNLVFVFSNRISAFDVIMNQEVPKKGEVLCKFADFWFKNLDVRHHMIRRIDDNKILVKKLQMIPLEFVVRGYFYGSLVERYNKGDPSTNVNSLLSTSFKPIIASKLPEPIFDPTTKSQEHDEAISREQIISSKIISENDFESIKKKSISLYLQMSKIVESVGFIMADVKFEFGFNKDLEIILADSLGPDEYRLWKKDEYEVGKIQDSYDKQLLRDWLIKIGFKKTIDEYSIYNKKPVPPLLPDELVNEISERYVFAYESITKSKF